LARQGVGNYPPPIGCRFPSSCHPDTDRYRHSLLNQSNC
jgi:hypothetical protein